MADLDALLAITILCLMFAAFILERYPPDVTGVAGAAAFIETVRNKGYMLADGVTTDIP